MWQDSNYDKNPIVRKNTQKLKMSQTSNCEEEKNPREQIVAKFQNSNCDKPWNMANFNLRRRKKHKKGLLVRTFWHLDNLWDGLWAAFCDSHNVYYGPYCP